MKNHVIAQTLISFRKSPYKEKVVLWLGIKGDRGWNAIEVFEPMQISDVDYFEIPPEGMQELMLKLGESRQMIVAQIHTHPGMAYHSEADDEWAIVRHKGAYSLVLPYFCSDTTIETFNEDVMTFTLNDQNQWKWVDSSNIRIRP